MGEDDSEIPASGVYVSASRVVPYVMIAAYLRWPQRWGMATISFAMHTPEVLDAESVQDCAEMLDIIQRMMGD
jgi:hypothetical protein